MTDNIQQLQDQIEKATKWYGQLVQKITDKEDLTPFEIMAFRSIQDSMQMQIDTMYKFHLTINSKYYGKEKKIQKKTKTH